MTPEQAAQPGVARVPAARTAPDGPATDLGVATGQTETDTVAATEPTAEPAGPTGTLAEPTAAPAEPTGTVPGPTSEPAEPTRTPAEPATARAEPTAELSEPTAAAAGPTGTPVEPTGTLAEPARPLPGPTIPRPRRRPTAVRTRRLGRVRPGRGADRGRRPGYRGRSAG